MPSLNVIGSVNLTSDIATLGSQTYQNAVGITPSSGASATLSSSTGSVVFNGTVDGGANKSQDLTVLTPNGSVTLAGSVGSIAPLNNLTATGQSIYILADILTASAQTYNGAIFIGDTNYVNKAPAVGFLFTGTRPYFEYTSGLLSSSIAYLDANPINVRTLISKDPSVSFNGAVNDLVPNTHTLSVAAIAPTVGTGPSSSISFNSSVGGVSPLYSINSQVIVPDSLSSYIGTINFTGGVATYADQTYRSSVILAQAETPSTAVTFSVYDPNASIRYLLPSQSNGQMNLQNATGRSDSLAINGSNNYGALQNTSGTGKWGAVAMINHALGYVAPAYVPSASQPPPFQQMAQAMINGSAQTSANVSVGSLSLATGSVTSAAPQGPQVTPGQTQLFSTQAEIAPPARGFVNIKVNVVIDGVTNTLVSSVPLNGFVFKVPDMAIASAAETGLKVVATLANGQTLPSWLTFDPETKTFTSERVPDGVKSFEVRFQTVDGGGNVVGESVMKIDTGK